MRKLIILCFIALCSKLAAQKFATDFPKGAMKEFFNNSNGELCVELYRKNDPLSEYRVFLVLENLEENDIKILEKWNSLGSSAKTSVTHRWSMEGKRVEVERYPYISYPPVFPTEKREPVLMPVKREMINLPNLWYPYDSPLQNPN
jgi:hypothetical protein